MLFRSGDLEMTVDQGVSVLSQIGVNTKASTVDGVQRRFDSLKEEEKEKLNTLLSSAKNPEPEQKPEPEPQEKKEVINLGTSDEEE